MSQPVGRHVRYRRSLALADGQEAGVIAHTQGGSPRVDVSLLAFPRTGTVKRRPIPSASLTIDQARRLRDMLSVGIEAADAARTGRLFDPDAADRALAEVVP